MQSQIRQCFTIPKVWAGGHYELDLCLGLPSEANIRAAKQAVWQYPGLEGPYADPDKEPHDQAILATDTECDHLFGVAQIGGVSIPCGAYVWREEDNGARIADFLSLYFPMSGLSLVFAVGGYPFGSFEAAPEWRATVDAWFLQLLRTQRGAFTFEMGIIGFESALISESVAAFKARAIPTDRVDGLVFPGKDDVEWYPPTP